MRFPGRYGIMKVSAAFRFTVTGYLHEGKKKIGISSLFSLSLAHKKVLAVFILFNNTPPETTPWKT
jgi:hypothetical protein